MRCTSSRVASTCFIALTALAPLFAAAPKEGEAAPDFSLKSLGGQELLLSDVVKKGPVVLVVLRGFPGYQCPICNRQVQEFLGQAELFAKAGAQVVMVYPGPPDSLAEKATEFAKGRAFPAHFHLLLDPDFKFTNLYSLRWNEGNETAYPSIFVLGRDRKVIFAKISTSHGGRASAAEVLAVLAPK